MKNTSARIQHPHLRLSFIISLITCFLPTTGFSQVQAHDHVIGTTISIKSESLNEEREVQIYLPENYANHSHKYPVLYVIDGQRYFMNAIAFQKNLTWQEIAPEFIVVGISTDAQKRRRLFYNDSAKFIAFLEKELIPKIDREYRTLNERIYFGWEMAAGLGLELFADYPSLFDGILMASPTHLSSSRLQNADSLLQRGLSQNRFIYASLGSVENWSLESMATLDSLFKSHEQEHVSWNYDLSDTENHYTTPLTTINEGLKLFFSDYAPLRFYSLDEFRDFGGLEALKAHYKNRSERYQIAEAIHDDTKHYLLLQCDKEDDFELFTNLVAAFDGKSFIADYYRQPRWFVRYAQFYMKNNQSTDAIEVLELGNTKFPDASTLKNEMGNYYKLSGEYSKAKKWYNEAIAIAQANGEPELEAYQLNLASLQE